MRIKLFYFLTFGFGVLFSCTKDKTPTPPEPTKWEKIAGNYKVYDTLGSYLYDLEIIHTYNDSLKIDTLIYLNLNNQFNLFSRQYYNPPNADPFYIRIGPEDPIFDKQNNRWDLFPFGEYPTEGFNIWKNDTILMK